MTVVAKQRDLVGEAIGIEARLEIAEIPQLLVDCPSVHSLEPDDFAVQFPQAECPVEIDPHVPPALRVRDRVRRQANSDAHRLGSLSARVRGRADSRTTCSPNASSSRRSRTLLESKNASAMSRAVRAWRR